MINEKIEIPKNPEVYWEKWVDAFDQHLDRNVDNEDDYYDDISDDLQVEHEALGPPIKSMLTPFGVLPLTEQSLASRHFKFWVGHTNFRITAADIQRIESCNGVETLSVITPYRFRIAVGRLFKDREVMTNVRNALVATRRND